MEARGKGKPPFTQGHAVGYDSAVPSCVPRIALALIIGFSALACTQAHAQTKGDLDLCEAATREAEAGDYTAAARLFEDAYETGHCPVSAFNLGVIYLNGYGVEQDYAQAFAWFEKSAAQGFAEANFTLGNMYVEGKGVTPDIGLAIQHFSAAAKQGHESATGNLRIALEFLAEEAGSPTAQYRLGLFYIGQDGAAPDYDKAMQWFQTASDQGFAPAMHSMGVMYYLSQGVEQDHVKAMKWFRRAALLGHPDSQANMGAMYARGDGVEPDPVEAWAWYALAARAGQQFEGQRSAAENAAHIEAGLSPQEIERARERSSALQAEVGPF